MPKPEIDSEDALGAGTSLVKIIGEVLEEVDPELDAAQDDLAVTIKPESIKKVCELSKFRPELDFNYLRCISVVDYIERLEINYHLLSLSNRFKMVIKINVPPEKALVPTVSSIWKAANWFERESHDLFGVVFEGHPNLSPLLLYDEFEGHPGLKSFPFHKYDEW
tara:strand:+ start:800 stop:1294 length:495 start_codon:yes stop_codon:yes gene_type:complete